MERFHRQLKSALKAQPHPDRWTEALPLVLLGIRASLKEDISCTAAELVYGTNLRLPGEFFSASSDNSTDLGTFVTQLKRTMQTLRATPTRQSSQPTGQIDNALSTASHVFVRHDAVRKPLQQPYDGPFKVVSRSAKYFTLEIKGRRDTVSIDRLKPAYFDNCTRSDFSTPLPTHPHQLMPHLYQDPHTQAVTFAGPSILRTSFLRSLEGEYCGGLRTLNFGL